MTRRTCSAVWRWPSIFSAHKRCALFHQCRPTDNLCRALIVSTFFYSIQCPSLQREGREPHQLSGSFCGTPLRPRRNPAVCKYSSRRNTLIYPSGSWATSPCHGLKERFSHRVFWSGVSKVWCGTNNLATGTNGETFSDHATVVSDRKSHV